MQDNVSLPGPEDRLLIVGRSGSGKTVGGLFHLSQANFDEMPWIVIDVKGDKQLRSIAYDKYLLDGDEIPDEPGLYYYTTSIENLDELEALLRRVFIKENTGLYIDEGYAVHMGKPYSMALRLILTQGRSKQIPLIINSQRPVYLDKFARTEASFIQVYDLTHEDDQDAMNKAVPRSQFDLGKQKLDRYNSIYYDVNADKAILLGPVPPPDQSVDLITERLNVMRETREMGRQVEGSNAQVKPRKI